MTEKEVKIIEDKKEIDKIIEEKIKGKKLIFTDWYKIGLLRLQKCSFMYPTCFNSQKIKAFLIASEIKDF